jgi:hypothetical protein
MVVFIRSVFNLCGMRRKEQHGDIFFISVLKQRIKFLISNEEIKTRDSRG